MRITIDTETRNWRPIRQAGSIRYATTCEPLVITYRMGNGPVELVDLAAGDRIPDELLTALNRPELHDWVAHNVTFDRHVLAQVAPELRDVGLWTCTAALARYAGLPGSLGEAGKALGLPAELLKVDDSGGIRTFTMPPYVEPDDEPERWESFCDYAVQDTAACEAILDAIPDALGPEGWRYWLEREQFVYQLDQRINDRGLYADAEVLASASAIVDTLKPRLDAEMAELTRGAVTKVQSPALKPWLSRRIGEEVPNLTKETVAELLARDDLDPDVYDVLALRRDGAKNSVAKYRSMTAMQDEAGRVRGAYLYHGAHTGRWSGQACQPQNLARPTDGLDPVDVADSIRIAEGDADFLDLVYDAPAFNVLMSGIRGALCAPPGRTLVIVDYAQIEARITAWYAGVQRLLDAFAEGRDVYTEVALDVLGKPERQAGKMMVLGLGYGMGPKKFAGINKLPLDVAEDWVGRWRDSYWEIPEFWQLLGHLVARPIGKVRDARKAHERKIPEWIETAHEWWDKVGSDRTVEEQIASWRQTLRHYEAFPDWKEKSPLRSERVPGRPDVVLYLPNGKPIYYRQCKAMRASEQAARRGFDGRNYTEARDRIMPGTFTYQPAHGARLSAWGGFLTENVVQATAREVMVEHMLRLDDAGIEIVGHSHDELIVECDATDAPDILAHVTEVMSTTPAWLDGCPLGAEGGISRRYTKL